VTCFIFLSAFLAGFFTPGLSRFLRGFSEGLNGCECEDHDRACKFYRKKS
jgi:hypothetical protein